MSRFKKLLLVAILTITSIVWANTTVSKIDSAFSNAAIEAKWTRPPRIASCDNDPESAACDKDKKAAKAAKEKADAQARREARDVGCGKGPGQPGEKTSCMLTGNVQAAGRACGDGEKAVKVMCSGDGQGGCGSVTTDVTCTNAREICVGGGGEESCSCSPTSCPTVLGPDKYRTLAQATGVHLTCPSANSCSPNSAQCAPTYVNSPPTCSVLPGIIVMDRESQPKQFQLSVTDNDYGDSVEIIGVKVVDKVGKLNSCITVKSLSGGDLIGTNVRVGASTNSKPTQLTPFLVDARESHGIFENVNGLSKCMGTLEITIVDADGDGPSGPDTASAPVKCQVNVEVENKAPTVSSIKLFDRDSNPSLREAGNLIDGNRKNLYVGSSYSSAQKFRAAYCKEPLSLLDPIQCPQGGEQFLMSRHNPLYFEFTVSDANGADDIMQAGAWLQLHQSGIDPETASVPVSIPNPNPTTRVSFQSLYSEKESKAINGTYYFISRGCLSSVCGQTNLATSAKQIYSGLAFIPALGGYAGDGAKTGNLLNGSQQVATTNEWHQVGFPDCLQAGNCTEINVPDTAKSAATANAAAKSNYAWAIGAEDNTLLCYPGNSSIPTVVQSATPIVCPANCAACMKREGVSPVANSNDITFKFGIYFNDRDAGHGMPEGNYSLFVSALDKVGVPINSVVGKGEEGWTRFDYQGNICTGATCAKTPFTLVYDPIAPKIAFTKWVASTSQLDTITATATITDNAGGSGVAGVSNRYIAREQTLDGEPLEDKFWAKKVSDGTDFDGKNDHDPSFSGGSISLQGKGLVADESVVAGACAYDNAGNMSCSRNPSDYVFLSAWVKTSFGDIFSSRSASSPFAQTIPTNTTINALENMDNTYKLDAVKSPNVDIYLPFVEQIFTAGTGAVLTSAANDVGITGGYVASGSTVSLPLGFKNNYRDGGNTNRYNLFGVTPMTIGNEFERTRAIALQNCDLLNETSAGTCQTGSSIDAIGTNSAIFKIISVGTATVDSLVCNKVNTVFVSGTLTIKGDVVKSDSSSGCMFVLASGATLNIDDVPSNKRTATADGKGIPYTDKFQAAVVANAGAKVMVRKSANKSTNKSIDRLEITGWVYSAENRPNFLRSLAPVDNRRYPSEWIIYDANLLDIFRPLLGSEKTVDLTCGTSNHVLCSTAK